MTVADYVPPRRQSASRSALECALALLVLALCASGCRGRSSALSPGAAAPGRTGAAAADTVHFTDITDSAGIRWTHYSGARGKVYMPEIESSGCGFIDYDGDGRPDIILLNGADWPEVKSGRKLSLSALYHNDGNGRFTDVTRGSGLDVEMHAMGLAVGDYDNDGRDDVYITCVLGPSHLFHNDGAGHFKDVTRAAGVDDGRRWGSGAAWLDYDRDGRLDLLVGNYCRWTPQTDVRCSVYKNLKSYCTPDAYAGDPPRLYHNEGNGRFKDVSASAGLAGLPGKTWGVSVLDYDGDGWLDIALANDLEPNNLLHNEHNGTFKEAGMVDGIALGSNGTAKAGMGIDAGDIDGSGRPSLLISNFTTEGLSLFRNGGGGLFTDASAAWQVDSISLQTMGWGLFFFDYDLDGRLDALVANGHLYSNVHDFQPGVTYAEPPLLLHNTGASFVDVASSHGAIAAPIVGRGAAYADIDGDGDPDVLILCNDARPRLYRNDGGNRNHWVRIRTVGRKSNRDGIGAEIIAETGAARLVRWVHATAGFLSSSELTVTLGLGNAARADRLTIRWPSGAADSFPNVAVDHGYVATEGSGTLAAEDR